MIHRSKPKHSICLNPSDHHIQSYRGFNGLYTTVNLLRNVCSRERAPVPAGLRDLLRNGKLLDLVRLHEELKEEAGGRVPCDVTAMCSCQQKFYLRGICNERKHIAWDKGEHSLKWPYSCVVRVELHHDVSVCADLLDVTTLRVVGIHDDSVPGSCALGQDIHVEAVEMDRMTVEQC